MRILVASLVGACMLTPAALAAPLKKTLKESSVSVTAQTIAADRSGQQEFAKITVESSHRTEDKHVKGRVELLDNDMNPLKTCEFDVVVAAAGKEVVAMRDCVAPMPGGLQLYIDSVETVSAPAPEEPAPDEQPAPDQE